MPSISRLVEGNVFSAVPGSRCPELLSLHKAESAQHIVQFYEDDSSIIENVSFLAAKALAAGDSTVLVATEFHLERIRERLRSYALNLDALNESGRFLAVDAAETLARFMVGGHPDATKFDDVVGGVIRNAARQSANSFVFAFGEMVALLCAADNPGAAIRLEQLWNSLAERHRFSLYCAYSLGCLGRNPEADDLIKICAEHALTIPTETSL
jgi:MEDS: MEthanogen/methylotroph, DcmR Sensory domain